MNSLKASTSMHPTKQKLLSSFQSYSSSTGNWCPIHSSSRLDMKTWLTVVNNKLQMLYRVSEGAHLDQKTQNQSQHSAALPSVEEEIVVGRAWAEGSFFPPTNYHSPSMLVIG